MLIDQIFFFYIVPTRATIIRYEKYEDQHVKCTKVNIIERCINKNIRYEGEYQPKIKTIS